MKIDKTKERNILVIEWSNVAVGRLSEDVGCGHITQSNALLFSKAIDWLVSLRQDDVQQQDTAQSEEVFPDHNCLQLIRRWLEQLDFLCSGKAG